MRIPKRYGQSKVDACPFCDKPSTGLNGQGVPVCAAHKDAVLGDLKCVCGSFLELREGKWGVFFTCFRCGNINLRKALEFNVVQDVSGARRNA